MATIKYDKLVELIKKNPEYIEYDKEISPENHLVILLSDKKESSDLRNFGFCEGSARFDTGELSFEIRGDVDGMAKYIEFI